MSAAKNIAVLWAVFVCGAAFGQPKAADFVAPVEIPVSLAGNVGEIRANHFHSGIDIRTQGVTGKRILAAADGYVARVSIGPGGYGKALYINHPNGTTTVYAHLDSFSGAIGDHVRDEQYRRRSFAVELYLSPGQLPVHQGDVIALSGNSGSSGGPHLHYEIRDAASQSALNFMARGWFSGVRDRIAPQFFTLWSIHVDTVRGVPVHRIAGEYKLARSAAGAYTVADGKTVGFVSPGYFAIEVIDRKDDTPHTMGLFRLEQRVDGRPNFALTTNRIDFSTTRDVNAAVHYALHKAVGYEVYRTYVAPNNRLPAYQNIVDRGVIHLNDSALHEVVIRAEDDSQNASILRFDIRQTDTTFDRSGDHTAAVPWDRTSVHTVGGLLVTIPARALYESTLFSFAEAGHRPAAYSGVYRIDPQDKTPLRTAITLRIRPDSLPERLRSKAALASLGANGRKIYEGGRWDRGSVVGTTRTFGDFFVAVDTLAPRLSPGFPRGADLSGHRSVAIALRDDFSGVAGWSVEVDGVWTLFDYDAKNNILRHFFSDSRFVRGKLHRVRAFAVDNKGNAATIETEFFW